MLRNTPYFYTLFFLLFFISCKKETKKHTFNAIKGTELITDAKNISIKDFNSFYLLNVSSAKKDKIYTYILYKNKTKVPDSLKKHQQIKIPVQKIVVTSTTHIPSLEMLQEENTLQAFPSTRYISSKKTRTLIDSGKITDIGTNQALNTEILLAIQPDVVIGFSIDETTAIYNQLEKANIPLLLNNDWTETTPLGKAEWLKFFGVLYNKTEVATKLFNTIKKDYLQAIDLVKNTSYRPTIMAGSMYKDQWFCPKGDSWAAQFLTKAQGDYLWKNTKGTGSLTLSFETVLDKAKDADFWIDCGQFTSIDELLQENPNYNHFKSVTNKQVYSLSAKKGATGGNIYYELAPNRPDWVMRDIIKIIHPELLPDYKFHFFKKLD